MLLIPGAWKQFTGEADTTLIGCQPIPTGLFTTGPDEALLYGWPTIALPTKHGLVRFPMFTVTLQPSGSQLIVDDAEISLNPAFISSTVVANDLVEQLRSLTQTVSPGNLEQTAADIGELLNLPVEALDRTRLARHTPTRPGIFNLASFLTLPTNQFTQGLRKELSSLVDRTDWRSTSAALIDGIGNPHVAPDQRPPIEASSLNEAQREALSVLRSGRSLVLTGPPGTGKTHLAAAMVADCWAAGKSVLVVSTNNAAVDNAVERANALVDGLLVRLGNQEARETAPIAVSNGARQWRERAQQISGRSGTIAVEVVLSNPVGIASGDYDRAVGSRRGLDHALADHDANEAKLLDLAPKLRTLSTQVWRADVVPDQSARTGLARRCHQATSGFALLRWFRRRAALKQLHAAGTQPNVTPSVFLEWHNTHCEVTELQATLDRQAETLLPARLLIDCADGTVPLHGLELVRRHVMAGYASSTGNTPIPIETARAQGGGFKTSVRDSLPRIRGWACTNLSLASSLPLTAGLFDVVIIDEASQCTIASALPALYRAKQAVIIGDPNQLTPVVQLTAASHTAAMSRQDFDVKVLNDSCRTHTEWSVWHVAQHTLGTSNTMNLDLHFRCHPTIARWFNRTFYNDTLVIATALENGNTSERGLTWHDCTGRSERLEGGSTINPDQADLATDLVCRLLEHGISSIGVVTPFASQAQLIERLLQQRAGQDIAASVTVATAHRFQGGERDVMVFSTVIEPDTAPKTVTWVEQQRNLINVAASRARQALHVIGHPGIATMTTASTLTSLRDAAVNGLTPSHQATNLHSPYEETMFRRLDAEGLHPLLKPIIDGYELDIAVLLDSAKFDIEIDGIHHLDRERQSRRRDIARDRALESAGWTVIRVPTWRMVTDPQGEAARVLAHVAQRAEELN